jgi:hypothetical protein
LRSRTVRREDLPFRFCSRKVDGQLRTGTALSAHRIAVPAGHDVIGVRQVAVGQSGGERVTGTGRIHDVLHFDAIDELLGDPAGAVPVKGHAATLIKGHAYRPDTAVQAVTSQVAKFFKAQPRRVGCHLRRLTQPRRAGFLQVHLQDVDVRQPHVPVSPHPRMALAAAGQRHRRAMGIQHHRCPAVLLDVPQRRLPDLVVGDRDTDNRVGIEHLVDIGRQDRVHKAHLPLDPAVLLDITQLDDVALVGRRRYAGGVDVRERPEDLLDRPLVLPADVRYRDDRVTGIQQSRQGHRRIQRASVLLEPLAGMGHDLVAGDRAQHRHLAARPGFHVLHHEHLRASRRAAHTLDYIDDMTHP